LINRAGGQRDGIERIKDDRTVVNRDENVEYMHEVIGYECKELKPSESEEKAKELDTLLKKHYDKYNVAKYGSFNSFIVTIQYCFDILCSIVY
jgi:hypothetical protein